MVREERTIEVTLLSATGLKQAKNGKEQKYYAVAYIYPARRQTAAANPHGGANPTWNATLKLTSYETNLHPAADDGAPPVASSSPTSSLMITVEIYGHRGGVFHSSDEHVGTVRVPLQDVAAAAESGGGMAPLKVYLPSGEEQGTLSLSVTLGAKRELGEDEDLTAAPSPSGSNDQAKRTWLESGSSSHAPDSTRLPKNTRPRRLRELILGRRLRRRGTEGRRGHGSRDHQERGYRPRNIGMTILGGIFTIIAAAAP